MNWAWLYVGALYFAAVFLARRAGIDLSKRAAIFFYALVLVFFFKPLTQDFVITQDDVLSSLPPWHFSVENKDPINGEMNDIPLQHTVWGHQAREAWKSLRVPLWNSFDGSGYPLLANGQSSALSPIRLLALPVPTRNFMAAEAAMKILIALTFAFLFCRGRGYAELASIIGATVFGFAGFLHSWLHFPHVTTACYLPAVLWLIDRLAEKATFGRFVAAAVVWTAILFGGHPETASHIFFLSLLYVLWIVLIEKRASWRVILTLGGAMTVAAMLSAPFLLPFLEALPRSQRYRALKVMPLEARTQPYTDFDCMVVLFQAHFFGRAPFEKPWGPAVAEPVGGFSGVLGIASMFALLVHIVQRRKWRSPELFFILASILVFGVINGWPLLGSVIHAVLPVVAHARFRLLFVFLMAIQSAAAIDLTLRGERKPLVIGASIVFVMIAALLAFHSFPDAAKRITSIETSLRSVAVLACAVLLAFTRRKSALIALQAAVLLELWSVSRSWNPPLPGEMMYPRVPFIRALQALRDKNPPNTFRVVGIGPMVFPNTNAMYGIEEIRAHDPMANDRYMGFVRLTTGYITENYHPWYENPDAPVLDYLNVKYLMMDPWFRAPADFNRWKLVANERDGRIYENTHVLPRFFAVRNVILEFRDDLFIEKLKNNEDWANTALLDELAIEAPRQRPDFFAPRPPNAPNAITRITDSQPTSYRMHVTAPRWTLIASSIPLWPGWRIERNGHAVQPIRVNGAFLGFAVPPGETDVHVYYAPWTWRVGLLLAGVAVGALAVLRYRNFFANRSREYVST
jgi:hypothetical protein